MVDAGIKEAIAKGTDPNALIKELQSQIAAAQAEIAREKLEKSLAETRSKSLETARKTALEACLKYAHALNLIDYIQVSAESRKTMLAALEEIEKNIK